MTTQGGGSASDAARATRPLRARLGLTPLTAIALVVAGLIAAPILGVAASLFGPTSEIWGLMAQTVLPRYVANTLMLGALVALGTTLLGVGAAWLVTMHQFPGRGAFEWALALPLAFPAYVIAYAYTDLLDHPGAVQTALRAVMGWGPRDYWFPEIRSLEGAAAMLTLVLYPYVYLLARAAFLQQSVCVLDVSRTLGARPSSMFFRVALPLARPAIATGVALALMETLADFGTVAHFGVQTFATGIYRAWFSMGDRIAAAQLSAAMLGCVLVLVALERSQRGAARYQGARARYDALKPTPLTGWRRWAAAVLCGAPVLFGFALPLGMLLYMSAVGGHGLFGPRYAVLALNSLTLAAIAAALTVALAVL
ncbi:MAG: ABC transporter permease subunit, partial [Pseudomonadota bacterium]